MDDIKILTDTRYDRLTMFYDYLGNSISTSEFGDFSYNGQTYTAPEEMIKDKNAYRKYIRPPFSYANTKQYIFTLYHHVYKFFRYDYHYYYIDCNERIPNDEREYAFGNSVLFSYIAMSVYELIKWLTGKRNRLKLKVTDEVFNPIFSFPQWDVPDYDANLVITMTPINYRDSKTIPISIFK